MSDDDSHYLTCVLASLMFLGGLYYYVTHDSMKNMGALFPTILVQKHGKYLLFNFNIPQMPESNPIVFDNLEEYMSFLEWQQSVGIVCPLLYVQHMINLQGEQVYKIRPSVNELHGGSPAAQMQKNGGTNYFTSFLE